MKVSEIMTSPARTVRVNDTVERVARVMLEHGIGGIPIVDADGTLKGIITESDFVGEERAVPFSTFKHANVFGEWLGKEGLDRIMQEARSLKAEDVMHHPVIAVKEDDSVETAVSTMLKHEVHRLPVVRDEKVVGMLTRHDVLRIMIQGSDA